MNYGWRDIAILFLARISGARVAVIWSGYLRLCRAALRCAGRLTGRPRRADCKAKQGAGLAAWRSEERASSSRQSRH